MYLRALSIALCCAYAAALTPLSAAGDDNECALYLSGPGRSSAYDYSLNLLKGNFGYEGRHTCITYDAVNQAYLEARNRIVVSQPKGDWKAEDFASVGELILDISINLARTYGLTYEEIEKGLPLIDTSRTLIREVCPPVFSHVECRAGKYRRLDGLCNNLHNPTWGSTMAPFQRLLGPLFADGINSPRIAHNGHDLPLSRVVSRTMHPDEGFHDHAGTVMVIAWGQFMDHDYTLTGTPLDPLNRNDPEECCKRPPHLKHPYCNEIRVPDDDYFYRLFGVKCIDFVRGFPSPRPGCRLGSRVPFNTLTGVIDGNTVYGVTEKFARKLRTGYGGLLRMNPVFKEYGLRDLLPLKLDIPDEGCTRPNKNMYCFEAGEIRVNEQLVLTVMHTLMAREHNRVANALAEVNPHWDDETLFQEARRINIAEIQHITYNEFLPILLGKDVMEKFGLVLEKEGYWEGYDQKVNPDVIDAFAAAAYRFGHSLLPTAVERWSKAHKFIASKRLSDLIRRPYDLYRAGVLDEYVMGLMNQVAQAMDDSITQEVTNHLFKKIGARFGMDLVSFNMQRGREFGLPGYMEFRKFCGLPGANQFQELFGSMSNETVRRYESIFEHPIDVDLWSGGVSERPLHGSMLGPTFACIIATQFSYSRRGDRFWFELPNQPSSFTPEQLAEIRKSRLARVICDNTDIIDTVQLYPMVLPDHELNPRVPCRSGIIPSMDFTKWAEPAPFRGTAKEFMTDAQVLAINISNCEENLAEIAVQDNDVTKKNDTHANQNSECNMNEIIHNQNFNLFVLQLPVNNTIENNDSRTKNENHDCEQDTVSNNCNEKLNEITNSDTVIKYVYKKDENANIKEKSRGHPLNSLRKKRSAPTENIIDNSVVAESKIAPLIVNYETQHSLRDVEKVTPPHEHIKSNIIRSSDLADFNIETLHDPLPQPLEKEKSDKSSESEEENEEINSNENYKNEENSDSEESSEREIPKNSDEQNSEYKKEQAVSREKNESEETNKSREIANNDESDESREKNDYYKRSSTEENSSHEKQSDEDYLAISKRSKSLLRTKLKLKPSSNEHFKNAEQYSEKPNSEGNEKSNESHRHSEEDNRLSNFNSNESVEVSIINESRQQNKPIRNFQSSIKQQSNENSDESQDFQNHLIKEKNKNESEEKIAKTNNSDIQEIDLGDFSYEKIKIDDQGNVVSAQENDDFGTPISIQTISKPEARFGQFNDNVPSTTTNNPLSNIEYIHIEPVHINDGEIKPVVEINSDIHNIKTSEENTKEELNSNNDNDQSLETLLGTKVSHDDINDKTIKNEELEDKEDIKQQIERIPVTYKHDSAEQEQRKEGEESNTTEENTQDDSVEHDHNDGTLDNFSPKDIKYDEHLKYKFDDLTIKLPEIKLPDDILTYAYETPSYENKKDKRKQRPKDKFYHYSDEIAESKEHEEQKRHRNYDNEDDSPRYGPYNGNKHKDKKQKDGEDDDEDLYEKFVRERFGKQSSFGKRAAKLQNAANIPSEKLHHTVQNILKQTQNIDKQAKNSGDPNAGYMWTLEYGEKL